MTTTIASKVDMVKRVSLAKRARSPRIGSLVSRRGAGLLVVLEDSHGDFASGYGAELIAEAIDEARHALRNLAPLVAAAAAHKTDEDN